MRDFDKNKFEKKNWNPCYFHNIESGVEYCYSLIDVVL